MKGMADYIHGLGLKAGLYSSPGPWTCGGCTGSWRHEAQDAAQYAAWGFDYLKYDWCSYGDLADGKDPTAIDVPTWAASKGTNDTAVAVHPYLVMGGLLRHQNRDIVFRSDSGGQYVADDRRHQRQLGQHVADWFPPGPGRALRRAGSLE
jgi:alpha-galactosidase